MFQASLSNDHSWLERRNVDRLLFLQSLDSALYSSLYSLSLPPELALAAGHCELAAGACELAAGPC